MNIQSINKCVINIPHRSDRLTQVKLELPYLFNDPSFHLIEGVTDIIPMLSIARAHLNCIKKAKEENWDHVLIMEDDVCFPAKEKTLQYVNNAFNNLPEDWDILLGGLYETDGLTSVNEYWNKTKQFCALHFYIVPEKNYDKMLSYPGGHHIDRWLNMNNDLNCYVSKKMFAIQHGGFSDNVKSRIDYTDKLAKFEVLK